MIITCATNCMEGNFIISITDLLENLGRPQVIIETTAQVISVNTIEPPILTCSVMKDSELFAADRIMWKKGGKTLARTRVSGALVLDTATNDSPTIFGMYTCEAIIDQSTAKRSILIAERGVYEIMVLRYRVMKMVEIAAYFKMELVPISTITCVRTIILLCSYYSIALVGNCYVVY